VVDSVKCAIKSPILQYSGFDICTGVSTSFNDVLKYINEYFKKDIKSVYIDNPYIGNYQEYTKGNPGYATTQLKFTAKWKIKDAIFENCKQLENEKIFPRSNN